jgi:hypothetical protein
MVREDFKCSKCGEVTEFSKTAMEGWSDKERLCPSCGAVCDRVFSNVVTDVGAGMNGNAKTGYERQMTAHPSFMGKMKGTKVK